MKSLAVINYDLNRVADVAIKAESDGVDIVSAAEVNHDPMLQLTVAAGVTDRAKLMTNLIVAFARSPMTMALQAHDLNNYSGGRFILGMGSQIKPHIERRFSMEWSKPAARMREYVLALKAIWACWYEDKPLEFNGEFYTHNLMTPMWTPVEKEFGAPPVYVAAVGPLMAQNAAEVADGILLHSFTTEEHLRNTTLPAIEKGLAKAGRSRKDLKIVGTNFFITGETEEEFELVKKSVRGQLAFYGSTPAYQVVLDSVGYGDVHDELLKLSKQGRWQEMGDCIDDTLLDKLAIMAEPAQITAKLQQRYGDIFDICGANLMGGDAKTQYNYSKMLGDAVKGA